MQVAPTSGLQQATWPGGLPAISAPGPHPSLVGSEVLPSLLAQPQFGTRTPSERELYRQQQVYQQQLQWQQQQLQQLGIYGAGQSVPQPLFQPQRPSDPQLLQPAAASALQDEQPRLRRQQRQQALYQRRLPPTSPVVPMPVVSAPVDQQAQGWPALAAPAAPPPGLPPPAPRGLATVSFDLPRAATPGDGEQTQGAARFATRSVPALWRQGPAMMLPPAGASDQAVPRQIVLP